VHERGQADQRRGVGQPGGPQPAGVQGRQPGPAGQRPGQRVGDVAPLGQLAPGEEVLAGERGCFQQPLLITGQHRHRPRCPAAHLDDDTAGPAADVGAADVAQVRADQPGARAQAPQRRCAGPPARRRLGISQPGTRRSRPQSKEPWPARGAAAGPPGPGAAPPCGR